MLTQALQESGKVWRTALGALVLLVAAGCGKEAPKTEAAPATSAPTAGADAAIPLNIGTLKIAALSNLYAAEKLGHFKEEGLKVTFTQMGGGAELLPAVSAGKIDITLSIPSSAIQARDKGFDFKMVMQNEIAAKEGEDTQAIFVNADAGIAGPKDLKGKRIAVNHIKNQTWLSMVEVLSKNGIDKNAVSFIELPYPNMEDALLNKQVDAVFNVEPFTSKMAANSKLRAISYPAVEALPGQPIGAFWASEKWLASHEQAAQKFVNAMRKTNEYLQKNPEETQKLIAEFTGINIDTIKKMKPIMWNANVDKATVQTLIDLMKRHELINSDMKADTVLYSTAVK
ncbi:MAG: transporter substrate-binding protein [Noviherbaspirillum sp.]|jgi:NitT/TauT family transport system substrate-binding protein|nr:transporter substrate-binding protein [Noviherbaspirillum sp.]MDB5794008.1 transporter substrate-binding protein [Noviherbaspirillum sp.]